jgi:hypothetical protein
MGVTLKNGSTAWDCISCAAQVVLTPATEKRLRETGDNFYCPNGHTMAFRPSRNSELKEELAEMTRDRDYYKSRLQEETDSSRRIARRLFATQGVVTRLKSEQVMLKKRIVELEAFACRLFATRGVVTRMKKQRTMLKAKIEELEGG